MKSYDLDGNIYAQEDIIKLYAEVISDFKREHPSFIDAKIIYSPTKYISDELLDSCCERIQRLYTKYSNILAGFDLVGQEDRTPPLSTFVQRVLSLPDNIKFFFHAGETNWFGSVDENLVIDTCDIRKMNSDFCFARSFN